MIFMDILNYILAIGFIYIMYYLNSNIRGSCENYNPSFIKEDVSLQSYEYLLNPGYDICEIRKNIHVPLIVLIPSHIQNYEKRLAIRSTWANSTKDVKVVFLLGSTLNEEEDQLIKSEHNSFSDIVQLSILDKDHLSATLKLIFGLKWTRDYCFNAKYVLKIDDDVLVNLNILDMISHWEKAFPNKLNNSFFCKTEKHSKPNRDVKSDLFMPYEDYNQEHYPDYCDGYGFMFKNTLTSYLYAASLNTKPVHLENIYIGLLANQLNSYFYDMSSVYIDTKNYTKESFEKFLSSTLIERMESVHFIRLNESLNFFKVWNVLKKIY